MRMIPYLIGRSIIGTLPEVEDTLPGGKVGDALRTENGDVLPTDDGDALPTEGCEDGTTAVEDLEPRREEHSLVELA